jgi:hypothetical protein
VIAEGQETMKSRLGYDFETGTSRDRRKTSRRSIDAHGWIRLEGGFALRPCKLVDLSDDGVRIAVKSTTRFPRVFAVSTSREAGTGRWAQVKWQQGGTIGAEFVA